MFLLDEHGNQIKPINLKFTLTKEDIDPEFLVGLGEAEPPVEDEDIQVEMPKNPLFVGLVGFKNSGKGTAAKILTEQFSCTEDSFAAPLKDAASVIFGWPRELLEGDTEKSRKWREQPDWYWDGVLGKKNFTPRLALQLLGTEAGRLVFGDALWTGSLINRVNQRLRGTVVSDVRFPNEIDCVMDRGGMVFRVKRGPEPKFYDVAIEYNMSNEWGRKPGGKLPDELNPQKGGEHISEWAWIGYPSIKEVVDNNGTKEALAFKIKNLISETYPDRQF